MAKPAVPAVGAKVKAQWASDLEAAVANSASGSVSITITTAGTPVSATVPFPSGRFTSPPSVTTNPLTSNPQTMQTSIGSVTATQCVIWLNRSSGTGAVTVYWTATEAP